MRIGLSCNFIEPALSHGKLDGIGVYTQHLHQQLMERGEQVVPIIFPSLKNRHPLCQLEHAYLMQQSYPIGAGLSALFGIDTPGSTALAEKIDIYHCTDYFIPRIKKIPVVAMIHDAIKVQHPSWNSRPWRSIKNKGLKKAIGWANHYIAPSYAVIPELVEHFGIDENKITVIHNAVSPYWSAVTSPAEKQTTLDKFKLPPGFILFTGTLQPRKNIKRIVDAFKSLPVALQQAHPLVLVGQRGWIEDSVIAEIKQLTQQGKVHWLNYITNDELRCLYQSAVLFLFPSLHEGFGIPILEAFASGTPVITANISAMPEVAYDAALLVDPYDTEAIRSAIMELLTHPHKREESIVKGKQRVQSFGWLECREKVMKVYEGLV